MKTKTHEIPGHCGYKNGGRITVKEGDKVGFVCEICKQAFEVNYNGDITPMPVMGINVISPKDAIRETSIRPIAYHDVERLPTCP